MINHKNFHPEICKLLDELEGLRVSAELRANDLLSEEYARYFARATADAYTYCMMRISSLDI